MSTLKTTHPLTLFILLWLAGSGTRMTLLATPPLLPLLEQTFRLSELQVGWLTSIPSILFAMAVLLGSYIIAKIGSTQTVMWGLFIAGIGSAARTLSLDQSALFAATMVMSLGIAIMHPALVSLVRDWLADHVVLATAVYTNGLFFGAVLPVLLTEQTLLSQLGSWQAAINVWSGLTLLIAAAFCFKSRTEPKPSQTKTVEWKPNFADPFLWKVGLIAGSTTAIYFTSNFFIPLYLKSNHQEQHLSLLLTALNLCQIPASLLGMKLGARFACQRSSYLCIAMVLLTGLIGLLSSNLSIQVVSSGMIGFGAALSLTLILSLPGLLYPNHQVNQSASTLLVICYSWSAIIPSVGGYLAEYTQNVFVAFYVLMGCALLVLALSWIEKKPFPKVAQI
jgi:CP family cyanate transporter-like MFS transporter